MDSQEDGSTQQEGYTPDQYDRSQVPRSDVAGLKQALINEKGAPELLQHAEALIARIQEQMDSQEALLQEWEGDTEKSFAATIVQYDLLRVKYLLRAYLRTRLRKLEAFVMAVWDDEEAVERLSEKEKAYALQYFKLIGPQMKDCLLQHLPKNFESMVKESTASEEKDMVDRPNLDRHVFCRVLEDCGDIELDPQGVDTAVFNQGDIYVVRYERIRQLLEAGSVELV